MAGVALVGLGLWRRSRDEVGGRRRLLTGALLLACGVACALVLHWV